MFFKSTRGADAGQNDWMLNSAKFVLSYIKPKCLWGENAPGLFDNPGRDLVEKLRAIADKYSYHTVFPWSKLTLSSMDCRREE